MRLKNIFFVTASALLVCTSAYAAKWTKTQCLGKCTDMTCRDETIKSDCLANCPEPAPKACEEAASSLRKSQQSMPLPSTLKRLPNTEGQSSQEGTSVKRALPKLPTDVPSATEQKLPQVPSQTGSSATGQKPLPVPSRSGSSGTEQKPTLKPQESSRNEESQYQEMPALTSLPKKPLLGHQRARGNPRVQSQPTAPVSSEKSGESTSPKTSADIRQSGSSTPSKKAQDVLTQHHETGAGGKGVTAEQMFALNEGKGVKVKHMKDKFEGMEKLLVVLESRIKSMDKKGTPFLQNLGILKEEAVKLEKKFGFDKVEVRNNPEQDIKYDPVEFSSISGGADGLNIQTCTAMLTDIKEKQQGIKGLIKLPKSKEKLSTLVNQLSGICADTAIKDANKPPSKRVQEAKLINEIYSQAKKIGF